MTTSNESDLLSTAEVARMFKVSNVAVTMWISGGKLPAIKTLGGHLRIHRRDLVKLLQEKNMPIPEELQTSAPSILVVDDEESIRNALVSMIHAVYPGVDVDTAENGVKALLKIGKNPPDLMILDIRMPEVDGLEVIRRMKAEQEYMRVKIIAISGYLREKETGTKVLEALADGVFHKSDDLKKLIESLPDYLPVLKTFSLAKASGEK